MDLNDILNAEPDDIIREIIQALASIKEDAYKREQDDEGMQRGSRLADLLNEEEDVNMFDAAAGVVEAGQREGHEGGEVVFHRARDEERDVDMFKDRIEVVEPGQKETNEEPEVVFERARNEERDVDMFKNDIDEVKAEFCGHREGIVDIVRKESEETEAWEEVAHEIEEEVQPEADQTCHMGLDGESPCLDALPLEFYSIANDLRFKKPLRVNSDKDTAGIYSQQCHLQNYEKVHSIWKSAMETSTSKHTKFSELIQTGIHLLQQGVPARPHTIPEGTWTKEEAHYLVFSQEQCDDYLLRNNGLMEKPIVIRDTRAFRRRKRVISTDEYLQRLSCLPSERCFIDAQLLSKADDSNELAVESMSGEEALALFTSNSEGKPPINFLNLVDWCTNSSPDAFSDKNYLLLQSISKLIEAPIFSDLRHAEANCQKEIRTGPGKKPVGVLMATDIRNCEHFRITAKAGALSGWHMDNCGVVTYVTVAGNRDPATKEGQEESDSDVIKLWPFIAIHSLPETQQEEILNEFSLHGPTWEPGPEVPIAILTLQRGDTLIMPPGTIHAPITVTDVSMSGGMVFDERQLLKHLRIWKFTSSRNNWVTNEPPPMQTFAFMKLLRGFIKGGSIQIQNPAEQEEIERLSIEIPGYAIRCTCRSCGRNCPCVVWRVPCSIRCHKKCGNDCMESYTLEPCNVLRGSCWKYLSLDHKCANSHSISKLA